MGIPGLTKFVNDHSDRFLRPYQLKNTRLVIDGYNLSCHMYEWYTKSLSAFGGDYDLFAKTVRDFFKSLERCNVIPIVIFDGGYEEKKLATIGKRSDVKLQLLMEFNRSCWQGVFHPLLLSKTFLSIIEELNINRVQCFFEADKEIAALARHFNCPVLSYDSDFFLFDVLYIPSNSVDLDVRESDSGCYLTCSIYDVNVFMTEYQGFDRTFLPLMAALLGNDYFDKHVFDNFLNHVVLPNKSSSNYTQRRILGVINWLRKEESVDSAVSRIISHTDKTSIDAANHIIRSTIADYEPTEPLFLPLLNPDRSSDAIIYPNNELLLKLPDRFIQLYQCCNLDPCLINMIYLKRHYVPIQVEDVREKSSQLISVPIISAIYKILNAFIGESSALTLHLKTFKSYTGYVVNHPVDDCFVGIDVKNIIAESKEVKRKVFYAVLSMEESEMQKIERVGNDWTIFFISLTFWMKNVRTNSVHIQSIIMMAIANYIQSRIGYFRNYQSFMNRKAGLMNRLSRNIIVNASVNSFHSMLESITELEMLRFTQKFIKLRQNIPETTSVGYFISTIHLFAMLQSVLWHVSSLNSLMDFPFPKINFANFYSGTLLYNLYYVLNKKNNVFGFLMDSMSEMPNIQVLYKYLTEEFTSYGTPQSRPERPTRIQPSHPHPHHHHRPRPRPRPRQSHHYR